VTIPKSGQTVHLLNLLDVLRLKRKMYRDENRNVRELELYTTDDLRQLYQITDDDLIRLRGGIVSRVQLVAEIPWRIYWGRTSYVLLLFVSIVAAIARIIAAVEG